MTGRQLIDHVTLLERLGIQPVLKASQNKPMSTVLGERMLRHAMKMPHAAKPITEGNRNNQLMSLAGSLRHRGLSEEEILFELRTANRTSVQPPLEDSEVQSIASSVMRYEPSAWDTNIGRSLNDTGNASRFVDQLHPNIRYIPEHAQWLIWTNERWIYDDSGMTIEMAKTVAKSIYGEAAQCSDPTLSRGVAKHAGRSLDAARIKAMVELAKSDRRVITKAEELDRNPHVLGVANGVLDLKTGALGANDQAMLVTRFSPVAFDTSAACPLFDQFLLTVTKGNKELVDYVQRVVGYSLSGCTSEQVLFFLHGNGANGKSTLLKVMSELMGPQLCRQLPFDSLIVKKHGRGASNDLARLDRVRVVQTSEVEDGSRIAESLLKQLTGGDAIAARFLYKEHFDFTPEFKLFIAGNHRPIIQGNDNGIWRRLHLVPFEVTIPAPKRDPLLAEKLRAELPGILNWALKGYKEWRRIGLAPPECVLAAVQEYRSDMDLIGQWVAKCCVEEPAAKGGATDLYNSYKMWAEGSGLHPMSQPAFGRKLQLRYHRKSTNKGMVYQGIRTADRGGC